MSTSDEQLSTNKKAWDYVAKKYQGACCLPAWGPFGVCAEKDLLGSLEGKTVFEIGCGSGHSIVYVASLGVKKAYGVDISTSNPAASLCGVGNIRFSPR